MTPPINLPQARQRVVRKVYTCTFATKKLEVNRSPHHDDTAFQRWGWLTLDQSRDKQSVEPWVPGFVSYDKRKSHFYLSWWVWTRMRRNLLEYKEDTHTFIMQKDRGNFLLSQENYELSKLRPSVLLWLPLPMVCFISQILLFCTGKHKGRCLEILTATLWVDDFLRRRGIGLGPFS